MKFLVAGSGALGSSFGSALYQAGYDVTLADSWQENIETSQSRGLIITDKGETKTINLKINAYKDVQGNFDCIILLPKSYQLKSTLTQIKHLVKPHTKIFSCMNGLGHAQTLTKYFSKEQIIMGVTLCTAKLLGPAEFQLTSRNLTEIKNLSDQSEDKVFCDKIIEAFNNAGLVFKYSDNIMFSIWRKACLNATCNSICAILDCNMKTQGEIPDSQFLTYKIMEEFTKAASYDGVILNTQEMTDYVNWFLTDAFPGVEHHPSMWQDIYNNKRKTEIEYLNGYVAKLCREHGDYAPYCELITILVKGKEWAQGINEQ